MYKKCKNSFLINLNQILIVSNLFFYIRAPVAQWFIPRTSVREIQGSMFTIYEFSVQKEPGPSPLELYKCARDFIVY